MKISKEAKEAAMKIPPNVLQHPMPYPDAMEIAAERIQEAIDASRRWIPVSERLPEHSAPIYAVDSNVVTPAWYSARQRQFFGWPNDNALNNVTHWGLWTLPNPPEAE